MEKRPVKEWLNELPEPYREKALNNMLEENADFPVEAMHWAIHSAFVFSETPEGFKYWSDLHARYKTPQYFN